MAENFQFLAEQRWSAVAMKRSDFRSPEAGRIHRSIGGVDTFVPSPLPPTIAAYDPPLVLALSRADTALSELSGVGRQLPNPHLLINPYLRQEAILSSRIEGTRASLSDVMLDELNEDRANGIDDPDVQEVRNYIDALELGLHRLGEGKLLTLNLVRQLHGVLMTGVRGHLASPGQFRKTQNWVVPSDSDVHSADYVPPPPELLMDCLTDWERFVNAHGELPDLVQCAILHEQFEAIHPFLDGNGRMGRLLITLFLIERGRLSQPLLYLSSYIEPRRREYYDLLQRVRTNSDWLSWIRYFLDGVEQTARNAVRQTETLMNLREDFRQRVRHKNKALLLVDHLFVNPYLTTRRAQRLLAVSDPTARAAIAALIEVDILVEFSGRSWRRVYLSPPILDALSLADQSATL